MKIQWLFWLMLVLGSKNVCAQCSKEDGSGPGVPSTLHGKLTYHDDLRTWHALKPDQNVCAWESIEVVSTKLNWNQVHRFRGCGVTITGNLFTPITGYYSLGLAMDVDRIQPDNDCKPLPIEPDLSKVLFPKTVKSYVVTIKVDYRNGGHVEVMVTPTAQSKIVVKPWQAYASYFLTGARDVIWFDCAKGFEMTKASQTPKNDHEIFPSVRGDNFTGFDKDAGLNTLIIECRRVHQYMN